ncbi:MAG: YihY/virulence factor BrkB family protein [Syntrophorhabdaceae bacterium]
MSKIVTLTKESFSEWNKDNAMRLAAALSYYAVFSLAPILVIIVSVAGFLLGSEGTGEKIIQQAGQFVGPQMADTLMGIEKSAKQQSTGLIAGIISVIVLIIGASGVFYELRQSLNTIWEVEPKPGGGIMGFLKGRLLSFLTVFLIGFLLFMSLIASSGISALGGYIEDLFPGSRYVILGLNVAVFFGIGIVLFACIFKMLPDAKVAWGDVWIGAVVTSLLFSIGKFAIGFYLSKSAMASPFGAAGSLIVLLAFIYYAANIFFLGAEFTQVYANHYGSKIVPSEQGQAMPYEEPSKKDQPSEPDKDKKQPGFRRPQPAGGEAR